MSQCKLVVLGALIICFCLAQYLSGFVIHRFQKQTREVYETTLFSLSPPKGNSHLRNSPNGKLNLKEDFQKKVKKCQGPRESARFVQYHEIKPSTETLHDWYIFRNAYYYGYGGVPREKNAINYCDEHGVGVAMQGYMYEPPDISKWDSNKAHWDREGRFPSVNERIRFYMGRWYEPPSSISSQIFGNNFREKTKEHKKRTDVLPWPDIKYFPLVNLFDNNLKELVECADNVGAHDLCSGKTGEYNQVRYHLFRSYVFDYIALAIIHQNRSAPILAHFFDCTTAISSALNHSYPVFARVRDIVAEENTLNHWRHPPHQNCNLCGTRHSSIIWPFNGKKHFHPIASIPKVDIPWSEKEAKLVWRGDPHDHYPEIANIFPLEHSSFKQRMALVENSLQSEFINAKFVGDNYGNIPRDYFGKRLSSADQVKFKYIMSIEGNDISTGLKWMLFSKSVVFCPPFTYTSWSMEKYLKPFYHYIPVHANMTNVLEMVQWAESHPKEAERISERSTLFIYDLFFHPDAYRDEELIFSGMLKRYEQNFGTKELKI